MEVSDRYDQINLGTRGRRSDAAGAQQFTRGRVTLSSECVSGCQEAEGGIGDGGSAVGVEGRGGH